MRALFLVTCVLLFSSARGALVTFANNTEHGIVCRLSTPEQNNVTGGSSNFSLAPYASVTMDLVPDPDVGNWKIEFMGPTANYGFNFAPETDRHQFWWIHHPDDDAYNSSAAFSVSADSVPETYLKATTFGGGGGGGGGSATVSLWEPNEDATFAFYGGVGLGATIIFFRIGLRWVRRAGEESNA